MATLWGDASDDIIVDRSHNSESDLYGMEGNDRLTGNAGTDYLYGQTGDDQLDGGAGDDWLFGGQGADDMSGGEGIDTVSYYDSNRVHVALDRSVVATGDAAGDTFLAIENLVGSFFGADVLGGNGADNHIWGLGGNDEILGRGGDDSLSGEGGKDQLFGEAGNDWLFGGAGGDELDGGAGRDGASYRDSDGVRVALDGSIDASDEATGDTFASIENLDGSALGADVMAGDDGANSIFGNGGADQLHGRGGRDKLFGGTGSDRLFGEAGDDVLSGGRGRDRLDGGSGQDTASYRDGDGVSVSLDGSLAASGQAKGDQFTSIEYLSGSMTGDDRLAGDDADNALWGNGGDDALFGRAGSDFLFGGKGDDRLTGGADDDYFVFDGPGDGTDVITDFSKGDLIDLDGSGFGLARGALDDSQFQSRTGHQAAGASVRLMFDAKDGSLWFDSDGSGAEAAVRLAVFANDYALTVNEIVIA